MNGEVAHEFISHYYPGVLEAMRTRWISPQILTTNLVDDPTYDEVKEMGRSVLTALGIETSPTHMEWFFGPKGLKFSEIGCRPPGVMVWDLYSAANDLDMYVEWAKLICHGHTDARASRQYAAGMIALRPDQDGRITHYDGVEGVQRDYADELIDMHLPKPRHGHARGRGPATWRTPGSGCGTRTTTGCAQSLTMSGSAIQIHAGEG